MASTLASEKWGQKHRALGLQACYTQSWVFAERDEKRSKTEKHAPLQAGGGRETTGARAGRVAGGDG